MKEILGFHLNGCPYCHNAFRAIEELQAENPAYKNIKIDWVEDQDAHELSKRIHMNTTLTFGSVLINNTKHNLVKAMTKLKHTSRLY